VASSLTERSIRLPAMKSLVWLAPPRLRDWREFLLTDALFFWPSFYYPNRSSLPNSPDWLGHFWFCPSHQINLGWHPGCIEGRPRWIGIGINRLPEKSP
jgi:hypothetical protein